MQPRDVFANFPSQDVPSLVRTTNDKFWVFPVAGYAKMLRDQLPNLGLKKPETAYLLGLVDFMDSKISAEQLQNLFKNSGGSIDEKKIVTDFGEVIGPFYALDFLKNRGITEIVFPIRQNYEVFDFFLGSKGQYYGFSSKALTGGSNTLAPKLIHERIVKMKGNADFRAYQRELDLLDNLTNHGMFEGVIIAFGNLIKSPTASRGFDISGPELQAMFKKVNFATDARKIEAFKTAGINNIGLSNPAAYAEFLNRFIIDSTKVPQNEKQKFKTGKASYTCTNIVYAFIKYIAGSSFKFDYIMRSCFQDLNIVKLGMRNGVPQWAMQSTVPADKTVTSNNYAFRSKAAFDRVKDKPGIQL